MKAIKISLLLLVGVLFWTALPRPAHAVTNIYYEGARPLAMGGAFSAVADDENAKWWNPAGMVYLPRWQFDIRGMSQISKDSITVLRDFPMEDINKIQDENEDILNLPETQDVLDYFTDMDEVISLQEALTLGLTLPRLGKKDNFALGLSGYTRVNVDSLYVQQNGLTSDEVPNWIKLTAYQLFYDVKVDAVGNLSVAYSFFDLSSLEQTKAASVGVNIKYLTRYRLTDKYDPMTVEDLLNQDKYEDKIPQTVADIPKASTLMFDLGSMCKPTDWVSFSVVVQDIGGTLVYKDGKTPMEHIPANLKVGSAFSPVKYFGHGPVSVEGRPPLNDYDVLIACEIDDLSGQVRRDRPHLADKLHAGLEARYNFYRDLFGIAVRGGSNQGFPSYGVGLDLLWMVSLDYTYYGNERDDYHVVDLGFTF